MGKTVYTIRFVGSKGTQCCDASFQHRQTVLWQKYLKHAWDNKKSVDVYCLCQKADSEQPLRLCVNYSEKRDRCWLSVWKLSGNRHAENCRFYSVWTLESQGKTYAASVVTKGSDGSFRIRLPTGLQKRDVQGDETTKAPDRTTGIRTSGKRKPAMTVLGLLHFMWEQTELNVWKHDSGPNGNSRRIGTVASQLVRFAEKIKIGKITLSDVLLVMANTKGSLQELNREKVRLANANNQRLILISTLASWTEEREERSKSSIVLGMFGGFPNLVVTEDVWERCEKSFRRELAAWRRNEGKIIVVAETEPPVKSFIVKDGKSRPEITANAIDIALMVVSPRFIPLDSGHEATIEKKLWEEERAFIKPLRYDSEEDTLPDFILTDTESEDTVPLEVFGMNTPEYIERKLHKQAQYAEKYGDDKWWSWDATMPDALNNIPAFPPISD